MYQEKVSINMNYQLHHGDCLEIMPRLAAGSVDAIICDPPYGTTACAWDSVIPFSPMWECIKHVIKPRGAVVLFGSQPFTSALVMSNAEWFRYQWVWEKSRPSGFINCDSAPLKNIEDICVFSDGSAVYNPQMTQAERVVERSRKVKAHITVCATDRIRQFDNGGLAYPRSVLRFANPNHDNNHPTQKPVDLLAYLIKTYTQPGETVLDFTMGSGSTPLL